MDLVSSLLQAIVSVDGEALVMRTGEKPYVIGLAGQIDLAGGGLTLDAVIQVATALLPAQFQQTLEESGVVQYNLPPWPDFPLEQFTVIAARGGDDVWVEVRRRRITVDEQADRFYPPGGAVPSSPLDADDDADSERPVPAVAVETSPGLEARPAPVLPLLRTPVHASPVAVAAASDETRPELERVLRLAAARGASTVYLSCGAPPTLRVDGELQVLHDEAALTASEIASWLLSLMASRTHESSHGSASEEWVGEIEQLGRVRCMTFNDHRGPGAVLRLVSRVMTAEQLGLSHQIVALAQERDGLVLVSSPRSSGKTTLVASLIDTINRTRSDHVITIEREITVAHVRASAFVSQREVRGTEGDLLAAATAALRENPDVLVLEGIDTPAMLDLAVETAARGHLVIGTCVAHSTTQALDRALGLYPSEKVERTQQALADCLRGVVSQVLPLKSGGGRIAARELLLGTPAVRKLIAEGRTSQLDGAMEAGRRHGMASLVDVLAAYVQNGLVDVREAYRHVADRETFRALLDRRGIDISPIERLA